jgi:hypothetical protein
MTSDTTITTAEEFNASLTELVYQAYTQGIDIEGGWECQTPVDDPNWDIVILELATRPPPEDD